MVKYLKGTREYEEDNSSKVQFSKVEYNGDRSSVSWIDFHYHASFLESISVSKEYFVDHESLHNDKGFEPSNQAEFEDAKKRAAEMLAGL